MTGNETVDLVLIIAAALALTIAVIAALKPGRFFRFSGWGMNVDAGGKEEPTKTSILDEARIDGEVDSITAHHHSGGVSAPSGDTSIGRKAVIGKHGKVGPIVGTRVGGKPEEEGR